MEALLAFGAALLALRLAGSLARRWRATGAPQLAAWSASLLAYALASAALAWGAAAGWNDASFRVYYTFGGLLTAPLLGVGSLLLVGRRWAAPVGLLYTGLAIGIGFASPLTSPVSGTTIPEAQQHLDLFPERVLAIAANTLGTVAVVADRVADDSQTSSWQHAHHRRRHCSCGRKRGCGTRRRANSGVHRARRRPPLFRFHVAR